MMIPKKIYNFMGYNNLGLMIEQERRHWLMKTDMKKHVTDLHTGEVYSGEIDNIGSDIIVETKKLPLKYDHHLNFDFQDRMAGRCLSIEPSAFPYSAGVGGLMYARIISMNYGTKDEQDQPVHNNYRLRLRNCEIVSLPIAGSLNSPEVFASKWLRTTTIPSLLIPGDPDVNLPGDTFFANGNFFSKEIPLLFIIKCHECQSHQDLDIPATSGDFRHFCSFCGGELEDIFCTRCDHTADGNPDFGVQNRFCYNCGIELRYGTGMSNVEYFYPLTETLQPLAMTFIKEGEYVSEVVNTDALIGYPFFWFNSDQTTLGPIARIPNNKNARGERILLVSNEGNSSKYKSKVYCGIDGYLNTTPDGTETRNYEIRVIRDPLQIANPKFQNNKEDYDVILKANEVLLYNKITHQLYIFDIQIPGDSKLRLSPVATWRFVNENEYAIDMDTFDVNCFNVVQQPLLALFEIHFDETIPFANETKNIGYAGMRASSANVASDIYEEYPHELNLWDGLPWYLNELHPWLAPQHNALYAIHNSPGYTPGIPNSRQVAALLMDPGLSPWYRWREELKNVTEPPKGLVVHEGETRWSQIKTQQQVSEMETTLPHYYEIYPIPTPGINNVRYIPSGVYVMSFGNLRMKLTVWDSDTPEVWLRRERWEIISDPPFIINREDFEQLLYPTNDDRRIIRSTSMEKIEIINGEEVILKYGSEYVEVMGESEIRSPAPYFEIFISDEHYHWLTSGVLTDHNVRGLHLSLRTNKTHHWSIKSIGMNYRVGDEFEFNVGPVQVHGRIRRMITTPEPWYQDVPTYEISLIFMNNDGFVPAAFLREGPNIDFLTDSVFQLRCPVCRDGENLPWNGKDEHHVEFDLRSPCEECFEGRESMIWKCKNPNCQTPTHCNRCKAALMRGRGEQLTLTLHIDPLYWNWLMAGGVLDNDQRGRVYVISNDPAHYENNMLTPFPKPARTVARICDVPTHLGQLQNINGVEQFPVVDNQYIRNTASFTPEDQHRILNSLPSRWVRPIHVDRNVRPVNRMDGENHDYVFKTEEALKAVDLVNHNEFREWTNLNTLVDPRFVQIAEIIDHGEQYKEGDSGIVIIGGFSFSFEVKDVHAPHQGGKGEVLQLDFYPTNPMLKLHLSNFNMQVTPQPQGITIPYGTATVRGQGEGLTFTMRIINYNQIIQHRGEIFDDLYALVDMVDGLWMWNYRIDPNNTQSPRRGEWVKEVQLSFKDFVPTVDGEDPIAVLDMRDSFLTNTIPSLVRMPISLTEYHKDPTTVLGYQTINFINLIETEKGPLNDKENNDLNVDLSKFICKEIIQVNVELEEKTPQNVFAWLKENHRLWFDCYVIWRWINPSLTGSSADDHRFEYGIITRSFNNFASTDIISKLPSSQLNYKRFVHTNIGTHVVWSIDKVGTLMWAYNPRCKTKESYRYDHKQQEVKMNPTSPFTWMDVDMRLHKVDDRYPDSKDPNKIVDENGRILWNVMTNNPIQANPSEEVQELICRECKEILGQSHNTECKLITDRSPMVRAIDCEPIYQQPEFITNRNGNPNWISINTEVVRINPVTGQQTPVGPQPIGNWQLVFPSVTHFSLRTMNPDLPVQHFDPIRLQVIRTEQLETDVVIEDTMGNNVNNKTLLINDDRNGHLRMHVYSDPNHRFRKL